MTMNAVTNSGRSSLHKSLLAAGIALSLFGASRAANADEHDCRALSGPFTSTTDTGPSCLSPIHLCTHGHLGGNFDASYDFTFTYMYNAGDPSAPNKFYYGGTSVVGARDGTMHTNDSGVMYMNPDGTANFVTNAAVASGDRRYNHTVGRVIATGSLNFATGEAVGSYTATLCNGGGDDDGHDHDHD